MDAKDASAGNRTRAARVAGEHSTTEPPMRRHPVRVTVARRCPIGSARGAALPMGAAVTPLLRSKCTEYVMRGQKPPRGGHTDTPTRRHQAVSDRTFVARAGRQAHTRAQTQVVLRAYTGARRTPSRRHEVVPDYGTRVARTYVRRQAHTRTQTHVDFRHRSIKKCGTLHDFACHPCAGAMLIFSVSFQF